MNYVGPFIMCGVSMLKLSGVSMQNMFWCSIVTKLNVIGVKKEYTRLCTIIIVNPTEWTVNKGSVHTMSNASFNIGFQT